MQRVIRLLLEALRSEGGDPPRAAFSRSVRVAYRACYGHELSEAVEHSSLESGEFEATPEFDHFYDILVRLVHGTAGADPLVAGEGNFGGICYGHPGFPPAEALYTTCKITPRGLQYLIDTA